uniref:Uncharacterized protein n=1 Tax=Lotus japonicus TaxID=34305 RepID=I3TAA4_LOTJA|nr:unknown [Lotus japonicus]
MLAGIQIQCQVGWSAGQHHTFGNHFPNSRKFETRNLTESKVVFQLEKLKSASRNVPTGNFLLLILNQSPRILIQNLRSRNVISGKSQANCQIQIRKIHKVFLKRLNGT